MEGFETLIYKKRDQVGYVTLNRPQALNSYNLQMRDDLYQVLSAIKADSEVRAVVFQGAGEKAFCAGADLSEFLTAPSPTVARQVRFGRDVWGLFLSIPQPLIAALHGYVLGSGMEIALCCDIRVASEDVRFGLPELSLGIIPAAGGTQTLPRIIGASRTLDMLLTNRWIGAEEALAIGLANRVVPKERLRAEARDLAMTIASLDPQAVIHAKQAVVRGLDLPLPQGLHVEKILSARLRGRGEKDEKP